MTVDARSLALAQRRERQLRAWIGVSAAAVVLGIVALSVEFAAGVVVSVSAIVVGLTLALSVRGWRAASAVWAAGADPAVLRSVTLRTGAAALFAFLVAFAAAIAVAVPAVVHLMANWTWVDPVLLTGVVLSVAAACAGATLWVRITA